mgnify:CR=1 FL=1
MPTTIISVIDFNSRQDLENYISAEYGRDAEMNKIKDILIKGKRAELEKLQLDDTNTIWGLRVVITDFPTQTKVKNK